MASTDLAAYADVSVTLRGERVLGAYQVASHQYTSIGRVHFKLESSLRQAFLIRQPTPFGVCADPDFDLCIGTELGLEHSQGHRRSIRRRAATEAAVASLRQRPSRDRPRVAARAVAPIDTVA